jgi:hypothetical protein
MKNTSHVLWLLFRGLVIGLLLYGVGTLIGLKLVQAGGRGRATPSPTPSVTMSPSPQPSAYPQPGPGNVRFEPVTYYSTVAERAKILSAGRKADQVIQSDCFRNFMSSRKLIQTNGRTPEQVAAHLQSLKGVVPTEMYSKCLGIWPCTSAVAYRNVGSDTIHLNRNAFYPSMSDCAWAATLAHESLGHSLGGYDHDFNWSPSRSYSVPYSMGGADKTQGGSAFDKCCK